MLVFLGHELGEAAGTLWEVPPAPCMAVFKLIHYFINVFIYMYLSCLNVIQIMRGRHDIVLVMV